MADCLMLDASPLAELTRPERNPQTSRWLDRVVAAGTVVIVPEIADYETRRELPRAGRTASLRRLDAMAERLAYLPLTTSMLRRAAELWAQCRSAGRPLAPTAALDGDVILAAQAEHAQATVVTTNLRHLAPLVEVLDWASVVGSPG